MSEVLAVRGSDLVMRELAQAKASVIEAQRVLIVGAGSIPKLLGELNDSLAELGYVCVPIVPAQGLYKTFADLLECPSLAPLLSVSASSDALEAKLAPALKHQGGLSEAIPFGAYLPSDPPSNPDVAAVTEDHDATERLIRALEKSLAIHEPRVVDVSHLDMTNPANWKMGDVFQESGPNKSRKWILDSLSSIDILIRSPNTTTTELWSTARFKSTHMFLERPVAEQSTAE